MALPFMESVINDKEISFESFKSPNFVGFLNPYGIPLNFSDKYGYTAHGQVPSIQDEFRTYYTLKTNSYGISPLEEYIMSKKYQSSKKRCYIEVLKRARAYVKEELEMWGSSKSLKYTLMDKLKLDIFSFLINCYSADTFFEGVGKVATCMSKQEFWESEYKNKRLYNIGDWDFELEYSIYKDSILAEIFKTVVIQYLGYHSIERVPRTITTSSLLPYQEFYHYINNGFRIIQLPKMLYNSVEHKYEEYKQSEFLIPDSEIRRRDEF